MVPIVITLVTEEGGSEELFREVQMEMERVGEQLDVDITDNVERFGMHMYINYACIDVLTIIEHTYVVGFKQILDCSGILPIE